MCGRVISHIPLSRIRKLARTSGSRRVKNVRRGFNIGPQSHQAGIIHSSHYPAQDSDVTEQALPEASPLKLQPAEEESKSCDQDPETEHTAPLAPRLLHGLKWGLSIFSRKNPEDNGPCINIRIESLEKKFKKISGKRCVVVVEGYYEWKESNPYVVRPRGVEVWYLAGLFTEIENGEVECGIVTTEAPEFMQWLHHRAPGIVMEKDLDLWLSPEIGICEALALVKSPVQELVEIYLVSKIANSIKNDNPDCCMKLELLKEKIKSQGIHKFFKPVEKRKIEDKGCEKKIVNWKNLENLEKND